MASLFKLTCNNGDYKSCTFRALTTALQRSEWRKNWSSEPAVNISCPLCNSVAPAATAAAVLNADSCCWSNRVFGCSNFGYSGARSVNRGSGVRLDVHCLFIRVDCAKSLCSSPHL